jgi:NitT/TauT family transport system ATP-binding protein
MIEIHTLTRTFTGNQGQIVRALGPLDVRIANGEFVCVVGPSGCGKSTLLRILAGLDEATSGTFKIHIPIVTSESQNNTHSRISPTLVFQGDSTFPWMTVHENVAYGLRMNGVMERKRDEIALHMIQKVGLEQFVEAYPHQLSGGMKQRVALARAWALDPAVMLMDEPFGALDEQTRMTLQTELLKLWEADKRKTVLFVTHSIDEALVMADRILVMSRAPGTICDEVLVPFSRPRDPILLKREPMYGELNYRIWQALKPA